MYFSLLMNVKMNNIVTKYILLSKCLETNNR